MKYIIAVCLITITLASELSLTCDIGCSSNYSCCDGETCFYSSALNSYHACGTDSSRSGTSCCYSYTALWWFIIILVFGLLTAAIIGFVMYCIRRSQNNKSAEIVVNTTTDIYKD